MVTSWLDYVAGREREIVAGDAPFVPSHALDAEALAWLTAEGDLPAEAIGPLSTATQRVEPWPDTVAGLTLLAVDVTVAGLVNANRRVLTGMSSNSGMRWHQLLSAEDAGTYKPDPAIYRVALSATMVGAHAPYLVAAPAWDLRAAAEVGLGAPEG